MKKKIILTIIFIISLLPMFLNWFSDEKWEILINGTSVLYNPITIIAILLYILGVWYKGDSKTSKTICIISLSTITFMAFYAYIDWMFKIASGLTKATHYEIGWLIEIASCVIMINIYVRSNKKDRINNKNNVQTYGSN